MRLTIKHDGTAELRSGNLDYQDFEPGTLIQSFDSISAIQIAELGTTYPHLILYYPGWTRDYISGFFPRFGHLVSKVKDPQFSTPVYYTLCGSYGTKSSFHYDKGIYLKKFFALARVIIPVQG
jgi:hypothetical protein